MIPERHDPVETACRRESARARGVRAGMWRCIPLYSEEKQALAQELTFPRPAVLAVSGAPGSGKTTLLEKLLPVLRGRGLKVGVIRPQNRPLPAVPQTDNDRLQSAGAAGVVVCTGSRYVLTEDLHATEQDFLALFERHSYDLVLLEGYDDSGWPKIEVVRRAVSDAPQAVQPLAVVGDIPGADFGLEDPEALADWLCAQMPML